MRMHNTAILLLDQASSINLARSNTFFLIKSRTWITNDFMNVFNSFASIYVFSYHLHVTPFLMHLSIWSSQGDLDINWLPSLPSGIWLRVWAPDWGSLIFLQGGMKLNLIITCARLCTGSPSTRWEEITNVNGTYANMTLAGDLQGFVWEHFGSKRRSC